jgi:hypothetical protein
LSNPRRLGELGSMLDWWRTIVVVLLLAAAAPLAAHGDPGVVRQVDPLGAQARRAGLRVLESERLVLVTDRPPRDGDGVDMLPAVFDRAFAAWCDHYGLDPESVPDWRACGCLVVDRERFRAAGLLPPTVPEFVNGFCDANVFWLQDQSNPAYRRHLLLHEGVHAFTLTVRGLATPVWYNEGIAEYLATHRLEEGADGPAVNLTPIPARAADVEQLGRIEEIRGLRQQGRMAALADVLTLPPGNHRSLSDYATSWAAVVLFARHPAYATSFAALERGPLGPDFTERLTAMPGYDGGRASRDFDAFTDDLDYGYDFSRSAIDWATGPLLAGPHRVAVAAGRGWQNAGLALAKARRYDLRATGRCTLGTIGETTIETEAAGISLDWYRGRPLGRLLAAQWVESPPGGGRPRFVVLGEGGAATITAAADGPLFLKLNEPPGDLADDAGEFTVDVSPDPSP